MMISGTHWAMADIPTRVFGSPQPISRRKLVRQPPTQVFRGDRPRAFHLMFVQVARGTLKADVLSGGNPRANLEEG